MWIRGRRDRVLTGGLILVSFAFCFVNLSHPDLQMWDEADNIGVVLESLEAGTPFHLQRSGEPYFDKPHLWYYLTEVLIIALGRHELAFRLVSATAGFGLIVAVILAARGFFSPLAGLAAGLFMLAVRQHFIFRPAGVFSTHNLRSADSDALMIFFLFAAFWMLARRAAGWRPGLPLAALFTALGLLAKGPLALMPALAFLLYQSLSPCRAPISRREGWLAAAIFAAVALPWHLIMAVASGPAFYDKYIGYVAGRVTSGLPGHTPGPFYYLRILSTRPVFFGLELSLLALGGLAANRRAFCRFPRAGTVLTLALIILVLQTSRTKIAWYVLPLYPFLAMAVAALLADLEHLAGSEKRAWKGLAAGAALAILALMAPFAARNGYSLARLERGPAQTFFTQVRHRCGDDAVYADERDNVLVRYLLLRHGVPRGPAGSTACTVTRTDSEIGPDFARRSGLVTRGAGFLLWRREAAAEP